MSKSTDVAVVESAPLVVRDDTDKINQMLNLAIEKGISVDALEKLVTLHERVADRQAASEFVVAKAQFKSECPPIPKNAEAVVKKNGVVQYKYWYAKLHAIASAVDPVLARLGFTYSWDGGETEQGVYSSTCKLSHVNGHSESSTFSCPVDTRSGMNVSQQRGGANSTCKRQSLIQVLGLTEVDHDSDFNPPADANTITEAQVADLDALASEVGADKQRFLKYLGVTKFSEIRANQFSQAVKELERKRK